MNNDDKIYNYRKELETLGYRQSIVNNYPKYVKNFLAQSKETPENISEQHIKNYYNYLQNRPNQRRQTQLIKSNIHSHQLAKKGNFQHL